MGYTNYYNMNDKIHINEIETLVKFTKTAINIFEESTGEKIKGGFGNGEPEVNNERIWLNGDGDNSHETFLLTFNEFSSFDSTKTNRKSYDQIVKACLIKARQLLIIAPWSFDGDMTEIEYLNAQALVDLTNERITLEA